MPAAEKLLEGRSFLERSKGRRQTKRDPLLFSRQWGCSPKYRLPCAARGYFPYKQT